MTLTLPQPDGAVGDGRTPVSAVPRSNLFGGIGNREIQQWRSREEPISCSNSSFRPTSTDGAQQMTYVSLTYPPRVQYFLRAASIGSMVVLAMVLATLAVYPALGLKLVWSLIIPAAPLIFFLVPNVWVSLCPFAIAQSIPRRLDLSKKKQLTEKQTFWLRILSWGLLLTMVPARHLLFNHDALILLLTTLVLATVVILTGFNYKGLSGWCMGACPIRPVEMMYGQFTPERCRPEVCNSCEECNKDCSRGYVQDRKFWKPTTHGSSISSSLFPDLY